MNLRTRQWKMDLFDDWENSIGLVGRTDRCRIDDDRSGDRAARDSQAL